MKRVRFTAKQETQKVFTTTIASWFEARVQIYNPGRRQDRKSEAYMKLSRLFDENDKPADSPDLKIKSL